MLYWHQEYFILSLFQFIKLDLRLTLFVVVVFIVIVAFEGTFYLTGIQFYTTAMMSLKVTVKKVFPTYYVEET